MNLGWLVTWKQWHFQGANPTFYRTISVNPTVPHQHQLNWLPHNHLLTSQPHWYNIVPSGLQLTLKSHQQLQISDPQKSMVVRTYSCPWKSWESWGMLIEQHLTASPTQPSTSEYVCPPFIIPNSDLEVSSCWVNDYWRLNLNTVPDNHLLPLVAPTTGRVLQYSL